MVNKKGNLASHTKLNEQLLKAIRLNSEGQDQQTTSLNVDIGFTTGIPRLSEYEVTEKKLEQECTSWTTTPLHARNPTT